MADHDHSYKLLFAHPRMVRDLVEGFVAGDWVSTVDFSTLERVSENYVSDDLRARADDIVWRVRCREHVIYLLLEFQSTADTYMAVRVLTYVGLLYQDLIRSSKSRGVERLPAILPIVLHSGGRPWHGAQDMTSLLCDVPPGLEKYRPQLHYLLIDERSYDDAALAGRRNLAALLFRLENCRRRDLMPRLVSTLVEWLQGPEQESLRRAFAVWLEKVVLKRLSDERARVANDLWERPTMLSERFDEWEKELRDEGLQKGEAIVLTRILRKRFGELPVSFSARLRSALPEQLESWAERLLDAGSLDEIFDGESNGHA
ncbi:MAG: Rpn family recombination-promoting nuclease/putative transposase [Gammaproteobacteria bacterium]